MGSGEREGGRERRRKGGGEGEGGRGRGREGGREREGERELKKVREKDR